MVEYAIQDEVLVQLHYSWDQQHRGQTSTNAWIAVRMHWLAMRSQCHSSTETDLVEVALDESSLRNGMLLADVIMLGIEVTKEGC
jgi:hypothetical protein